MFVPIDVNPLAMSSSGKGVLLLDRDGVINRKNPIGYVTRWEDFEFLPGSLTALRRAHEMGLSVRIVSNQSCIGRGLVERDQIEFLTVRMIERIRGEGGEIDGVFICPHAPWEGCRCRKPEVGLLRAALFADAEDIPPAAIVGDSRTDIDAGQRLGISTVLVDPDPELEPATTEPDFLCRDLREAIGAIESGRLVLGDGAQAQRTGR